MIFQICKNFAVILSQVTTGGCVIPKEESISRERNNAMQKKKCTTQRRGKKNSQDIGEARSQAEKAAT